MRHTAASCADRGEGREGRGGEGWGERGEGRVRGEEEMGGGIKQYICEYCH